MPKKNISKRISKSFENQEKNSGVTFNIGEYNIDKTGQHYMIDKSVIDFIISQSELKTSDIVLEVGPGKGALTRELSKKCKVIAIDIDSQFFVNKSFKNVTFIKGNVLSEFEYLKKLNFNKVVSNIPYNISEPLMRQIFKTKIDLIIVTVGEKFSKILTSKDNRIGILANSIYEIEILKIISPKSFSPPPKVNSAVVRIKPKAENTLNSKEKLYYELLFYDDKKLKNAMSLLGLNKSLVKSLYEKNAFLDKKLFQLTNEESLKLDKLLSDLK